MDNLFSTLIQKRNILYLLWGILFAVIAVVICEETHADSPLKGEENKSNFGFRIELFSKCSKPCGGGKQLGIYVCYNKTSTLAVPPSHCRHLNPPGRYYRVCKMRPCAYRWHTGTWSSCSTSCGEGTKQRHLKCIDRYNVRVSAWKCARIKIPHRKRKCGVADCKPEFYVGPWSKCSSTCGEGRKNRTVTCKQSLANGTVISLPHSSCDGMVPAKAVKCKKAECIHESSGGGQDIQGEEPLDQEADYDASDASAAGSGEGGGAGKGTDPPIIKVSTQPKYILKNKGSLSVLVGTKVWTVKGSEITVSCTATGKFPSIITWTRDGYEITSYFEDDVGIVNGKLKIRGADRFNEGTYVCEARSQGGTSTDTFALKILVPNKPTIFADESSFSFGPDKEKIEVTVGGKVTLFTGSSLTIKCPVIGKPKPRVWWLSQGRPISVGKAKMIGYNLVIDNIDKIYSLEYTCKARNFRGRASASTNVIVLDLSPPRIEAQIKVINKPLSARRVSIVIGTNLTLISGASLMIRCPVSSKPTPLVSWMAKGTPITGRVNRIMISRDRSSMIVSKMVVADTGLYSCMAKNVAGKDTKASYVKILAPQVPTIQSKSGFRSSLEKDQEMTVTIGEQATALAGIMLKIVCPAKGLPSPTISWQINRRAVSRFSRQYVAQGNTLVIKKLSRNENGNVACTARNPVGSATSSSKVNVIAGLKPQIKSKTGRVIGAGNIEEASITIGQDLRIIQGLIFRLQCPVTGFPRPTVTWSKNDKNVVSSQRVLLDKDNNDLIINGIEKEDTGQYMCTAVNPLGEARKSSFISIIDEKSVSIEVGRAKLDTTRNVAPVTIKIGDSLTALSGTDVSIRCPVKGVPFPYVKWRRNGTQFEAEDLKGQFRTFERNTVLKIFQVSPEVAGEYECIATNVGGADRVSSTISVVASQSPSINFGSARQESLNDLSQVQATIGSFIRILAGSILSIACPSSGVPRPTFSWDFNGRPIKSQGRFQFIGNSLVINQATTRDTGRYRCTATNIVASDKRHSDVTVLAPIKPQIQGKPQDKEILVARPESTEVGSTITILEGASLQLTCTAKGLPKPKIQWKFEEIVVSGEILKLPNLDPGDSKNYTCEASNLAGVDRRVTSLFVRALEKPVILSSEGSVSLFRRNLRLAANIGKSVSILQGTVLRLLCHVAGYPQPTAAWTKDTVALRRPGRGFRPLRQNLTHYFLDIDTGFRADFNGKYECVASNAGGSIAASSVVVVKAPSKPVVKSTTIIGSIGWRRYLDNRDPRIITIGDNAEVLTGTEVTINCPVTGLPEPSVTWSVGRRRLTSGGRYIIPRSNVLVIGTERFPTTAADSLAYRCDAGNYLGGDFAISKLIFTDPRPPKVRTFTTQTEYLTKQNITITIGAKISAIIDSNITLKCQVEGLPTPKIAWLRNGVLQQQDGPQYVISKASKIDTGAYQCTASNLAGTRSATSVITIQDPRPKTEKPKIFPANKTVIFSENKLSFTAFIGSNLTILEGKNLVLQCPTTGLPKPIVSWYFNNKPVVRSETLTVDPDTGDLTVIEMMKEESGVYMCKSKNIAGEDNAFTFAVVVGPKAPKISVSSKVYDKLDPTRKPIKIYIGDTLTTFKGTRVAIKCPSTGFPDPRIRWSKDDISLAPQVPVFINGSMIILTNPEVSDTGKYTCLASNSGGNADASSNVTFLAPQSPNITITPGDVEYLKRGSVTIRIGSNLKVLEGDSIAIQCDATGIPTPTLSWRRNQRILTGFTGNVLRASNIRRADSGTITCEARNYFGRNSKTSVITVIAGQKPKIKTSIKAISAVDDLSKHSADVGTSFKVLGGSRIRLSCSATGIPTPEYSWRLNNKPVVNSDRIYFNQSTGVLDIKSVVPGDSGQAQCTATNVIGTDRSQSSLNIIALRGPFIQFSKASINTTNSVKPIRIRIGTNAHSLVNTTINIVCQIAGLPLPVTSWSYNNEVIRGGRVMVKGTTLTIPRAQMDDGGVYACTAKSAAGNLTVKSQISLNPGQRPSISTRDDVITEHSDFSTTSATIGSSVSLLTGASLSLICPVKGLPPPVVLWKINGRNAIPGKDVVIDRTKNILTLPKLQSEGARRTVTCTVVNPLGSVSVSSDVTVIEPISPRINSTRTAIVQLTNQNQVDSLVGNKITILEGTSVSLACDATGLPKPEVDWTLANIPVTSDGHVTIDGGVVKIIKVGRGDAGTYTCKATSLVGMDTAATVIQVKELRGPFIDSSTKVFNLISSNKPIEMKIGSNLTALSTTNITIDCSTNGFPVPVTSWRKDGKIIIKDHVTVRGSKLIITRARFTDGGVYECKAKSVAGERKVKSHLTIIAGQKPIISSSDEVKSSLTGFTKLLSTIGSSISILAGSGIRIMCPVGGIPKPVVTWNIKRKSNNKLDKTQNSVTIPRLVSGDSGEFTCIAKNILGEARASSTLNVIEPFKPRIDKSGQRINVLDSEAPVTIRVGATARVLAGVSITINCKAVGLPYPKISWSRGGKPLKSKGHVTVEDSKLVILNGGSEDSGTYGCVASNAMGKDNVTTRLTIHSGEKARITTVGRQVSFLDGFVNITSYVGDNITALTGSDLTIFCPIEGIPEPRVSWSRAGGPLRSDRRYSINPITNSLKIKNLRTEDSGGFTCSSRNNRGGDHKTSLLNVVVPYGPTIKESRKTIDGLKSVTAISITTGDNLTALVNATITIQCKASGLPLPKTSWTRNGVKLVSKGHLSIGKDSLRIQKATLGDQGVYKCTAKSDAGAVSASSVVVVKEPIPPSIKSSNKTVVSLTRKPLGIIIGETVRTLTRINFNITCEVEGLPTPEIIWRKNGVELPIDGRTYASGPIIYVADALTADTGFYVCEAKNVAGKKTVVSKLNIREPSVPEIPVTYQRKLQRLRPVTITTEVGSYIKTLETSNITLSCDAKGFPEPIITWKKGVKTLDVARGNKTYTITKATASDSGIYTCTATNLKGYDFRSSNVSIVAPKAPTIKTTTKTLIVLRKESVESDVGVSLTTLSDNTIKLICNVSGVPKPTLEWYKNNAKMDNKASFLIFSPASPRDTGVYSCAAKNLAGMVKVDTSVTILEGKVPSIITSKKTISELTRIQYIVTKVGGVVNTLLSSNVEIMCEASGFPKPEVTWFKDGEQIPKSSATHMIDSKSGTLMFVSLALRKAGIYKCVAKNSLGTASASTVLNVKGLKHPYINSSRGVVTSLKSRKPAMIYIGHNLTVLSGTNFSITCPSGGVPLPEVTWTKGKVSLASGGRVNVSPKVLSINKAVKSDSGRYTCSVENVMGKISIFSNVKVLDPVVPNILYKFSILKVTEIQPIDTSVGARVTSIPGNRLTLTCNVSGLPTPSITWKRNNLLAQEGGSNYTVPSLKISDSGAYTCVATNLAGEASETSNVFVIAGRKPEIVTTKTNVIATEGENEVPVEVGGNITTIVGTGIEISCEVTGKPTPSITWLQNGSVVEETSVRFINGETKALTLLGVTQEDSGFYTCFANNTFGLASETSHLTVFAAERPSIRFSKREIEDYEKTDLEITIGDNLKTLIGTTITIYCNATGNPPPEIEWFKSESRINSNFPIKASNNTLIIYGATWSDTGEYECQATNAAGLDKKTSFVKFVSPEKPVTFQDPSVLEVYNRTPVAMTIGNTLKTLTQTPITISCAASGIPMPTYSWTKRGNPIVSSNDLEISQGGKQLTIRNLVLDDAGIYGCKAKNKAGTDAANAPILVLEPILPRIESTDENITWYDRIPLSAPIGGKITALTGTQVTLTCNAIGFPEPIVVWRRDDEVNILETDGQYKLENRSLVIFAVQPGDSGSYKCFAENLAGTVKSATQLNVIDPQEPVIMTSNKIVRTEDRTPVIATIGNRIFVIAGTPVSITCPVKGIPKPSLSWSNGGRFLYPTNNNSMLVFANTTVANSGEYTCTAISPIGGDVASSVLSVAEPVKPQIVAPPVAKVIQLTNKTQGSITIRDSITVLYGTVLDIKCSAVGLPKPKIIWKKENRRINEGVSANGTLKVRINRKSDAGRFTCIAMNSEGEDRATSTVRALEPLYPRIQSVRGSIDALDQPRTTNATVGTKVKTLASTTVILQCPATGSPDPIIQWSKSGQLIVSGDRVILTKRGDLVIQKSHVVDSGEYTCLARNVLGEDTAVSTVIIMNPTRPEVTRSTDYIIWYENRPFKSKIGNNLTTMKGRKLTLVCPAKGMPRPKITWYRGGERMRNEYNYLIEGNTLVIWDLSVFDTDRYTCVAENYAGSDAATSTVKVHEPVEPYIYKSRGFIDALSGYIPVNVTAGQDVKAPTSSLVVLICPIRGVPRPKIIWLKDQEPVLSDNTIEVDCNGTLKFHAIRPTDAGEYICYVESFLGMDLALTHVEVVERSIPVIHKSNNIIPIIDNGGVEATIGDNVTALLTQTIVIKCNATGIPYPVITWTRNGLKIESVGMYSIDDQGTLTITGVVRDGVYKCSAKNDQGSDSATSHVTVKEPKGAKIISPRKPKTIPFTHHKNVTINIRDNVTILPNATLTIKCEAVGVPEPSVTWSKDGNAIPPEDKYQVLENGALVVKNAAGSDSGRYTCKAENTRGVDTASSLVNITKPTKPVIDRPIETRNVQPTNDGHVTVSVGENVTAVMGTRVLIDCIVDGSPKPSVIWTKDNVKLKPDDGYTVYENGTLEIPSASVKDRGRYECTAKSPGGEDSESIHVMVVEQSKPVITRPDKHRTIPPQDKSPVNSTVGDNVTVLTDSDLIIHCPSIGVPEPTHSWRKDGKEIILGAKYSILSNGTLVIKKMSADEKGSYTCTVENIAGSNNGTTKVDVVEPEKPKITRPSKTTTKTPRDRDPVTMTITDNVTALENTSISIDCPATGIPKPMTIWKKDEEELSSGEDYVVYDNGTLWIKMASLKDKGRYTCLVRNKNGEDNETSVVDVVSPKKPKITRPTEPKTLVPKDRSPINMTIGDNVTALTNTPISIDCQASGIPKPKISWRKDGQEVIPGGGYMILENGTLVIEKATAEDRGRYTCVLENLNGKVNSSTNVEVVDEQKPRISRPDKPRTIPPHDKGPVNATIGDNVTVLTDSDLTIHCPSTGVPEPTHSWSKDGEKIKLGINFFLLPNGTLIIKKVSIDESGTYKCTVENIAGNASEVTQVLAVAPKKPQISKPEEPRTYPPKDRKPVNMSVGNNVTSLLNTPITIVCSATGTPKPTITWMKDGKPIDKVDDRYSVFENGTLLIARASQEDQGKYTCIAKNKEGEDNVSSTVNIASPNKPKITRPKEPQTLVPKDRSPINMTIGDNVTALTNTPISIDCLTSGIPKPKISWRKDGQEVIPGGRYVILGNGTLVIKKATAEDRGRYTCVAKNVAGEENKSSAINVTDSKKPKITAKAKPRDVRPPDRSPVNITVGDNITALTNTDISIDCPATGTPRPTTTWLKDGKALFEGDRVVVLDNGTLVIKMASAGERGRYTCRVKNIDGEDNKTTTVDVVGPKKPKFTRPKEPQTLVPKDRSPINMTIGDNVTALTNTPISIDCQASGIPKPKISWRKDGQEVIPGGGYMILENGTLVIEKATAKDRGRYTCVAKNVAGEKRKSSAVNVTDSEKPKITAKEKPRDVRPPDRRPVNITVGDNITALTKTDVSIDCPATGTPKPTTTWLKDGKALPEGDRVAVLGNGTLVIKMASAEERGRYTCRIKNIDGEDNKTTTVDVVAPKKPKIKRPKKPQTLVPKDRSPINMTIGDNVTALTNTPISIDCQASGIPKPKITWRKDGQEVIPGGGYVILENGSLVIKKATAEDRGRYTCVAKNVAGEKRKSSAVNVTDSEKPKITAKEKPRDVRPPDRRPVNITVGDNITALTKTDISIDCPATGTPKPTTTWLKDGKALPEGDRVAVLGNGTLVIKMASAEERGRYTCRIKNIDGEDNKTTTVDVVGPKKPKIKRPKEPQTLVPKDRSPINMTIGDNVTALTNTPISIDCQASGIPKPKITWRKDGQEVIPGGGYVILENGSLVIKKATAEDRGRYTCVAKNVAGEKRKSSAINVTDSEKPKITAKEKPRDVRPPDRRPVNITVGDNITALTKTDISIDCPATGTPKPTTTWLKDGKALPEGDRVAVLGNGTLVIKMASAEERGRYTCRIKNIDGEDNKTTTVDVVAPKKPKIKRPKEPQTLVPKDRSPINMTIGDNVTALTNTPISIDCQASGIPKPKITWRKDGQEVIPGGGYVILENGSLVIKKATAEDRGRYTCVAKNVAGEKRKSSAINVTDSEKPKITAKEKPRDVRPPDRRPVNITVGDNITALTKTDISIDCPATGTPKPTTTWLKDGKALPEGDRVAVLGNGTLVIKMASAEERGRYTCRVKNIDGEDNKTTTVDVVDSEAARIRRPKNPRNITSEDGTPVSVDIGNNIIAIANSRISINCPVTGTPKPLITWRENGFELVERKGYSVLENGTLVIENAKAKDKGQYTCIASNIAGKDSVTTNIKVLKPTTPTIAQPDKPRSVSPDDGSPINVAIGDNVTALTGTPITIDCQATGVPNPQVIWTKDGRELNSGSGYVIYENGSLLIVRASREERGRYKCTVKNKNGEDSKTSTIDSVDPTKPEITRPDKPRSILPKDRSPINMTIGDNVTALTNTPISIDCQASGIPKPKISWNKDGQPITTGDIFVVHESGTLFIKQARKGDEGKYTCTTVNSIGKDSKSSHVAVVDSKKPSINETGSQNIPVGEGGPKAIKTGDNVTTIPDTPIRITCNADGIPKPTVTWYKDGRKIGPGDIARVLPNNTLLLLAVTYEQGGVYACKARNIDGEDTSSSKVTVVSARKPFILVPEFSRNIRVGNEPSKKITISDDVRTPPSKKITITCTARGMPEPKIIWSRNGVVIRTGGDYEIDKNNTLTLKDVKLSHGGTYTCTAKNVVGEDRASSKVTVVTFTEPQIRKSISSWNIQSEQIAPVVMAIGDNITAFSGSTITITCNASGIPKPLITWRKDGRLVIPGQKQVIDQKGSLKLRGVVSEDSGRYTCVAMNFAGRDTEDSFVNILTPQSPSIPVAQIKQEIDVDAPISVDVGADVTALTETTISINCKASGLPEPTITWSKDGQLVRPGEFYEVLKNNTLVIRQAQDYDSGVYACTAKNIFGEDKKYSTVTVIEAEIPVIQRTNGDFKSTEMKPVVVNIGRQVTSLTRVNINLNCTARGKPSPSIEWMNGGKMLDVKGPLLSLKNVSVTDSGKYTCIASNVAGKANASTFINITEPVSPVIHTATSRLVVNTVKSVSSLVGKSIEMLTGSSLLLICNATGHPAPKIKWTKSGLPLASRDRYIVNDMSLRIFGVKPTDTSEITCTATNVVGEAMETSELVVKDLLRPNINAVKQEIKNFDKTKPIRVPVGTKLITTLNTTVVVRCPVIARPRAALSWQRNGQALVTNDKYKLNGDKSELIIIDVQFSDEGVYVCSAFNRAGTDFASMDLTVAIPPVINNVRGSFEVTDIRELISITTGAVVTIPKGVSIKIKCDATGVPTPNITWYRVAEGSKNWEPVGRRTNDRLYVDKDSFLSIQRSKEVDIARYICVATNVAGRDEGVTHLNIGVVPDIPGYWAAARKFTRPIVKRIETMATVIRGSTLRLRCTVYGSPKPDVTWYVVGNENRDRWKIFPDGTLQIQKVDFSDEGNYTCIGKNEYGTTYRSTNVTVLVPPRILDKFFTEAYLKSKAKLMYVRYSSITKLAIKRQQTRSAAVEKAGNLIIGCPVRGRPEPTILWLKNGLKVRNDSKHLVLDGVLMIRNISDAETGEYFCFVRNTAGEDGGGLELHVRDKIVGSWKVSRWSECQYCYGNFLGYTNRTVDCMDERNNTVPESYCSALPAPPTRQKCRTRSCEAIWTTSSWSQCSALCGGNGIKKRTVKCVFYTSLLPAGGLCNPAEKPVTSEPCNRAPCGQRICKDRVNYCKQIKDRNLCTAYRAWCCETCGGW